jgi:LmbE family N-acetylglucosaminyl deacetylase
MNGKSLMKKVCVLLAALIRATSASGVDHPDHRITADQAQTLVLASLTGEQKRLPSLGVEPPYTDPNSSRFLFYEVTWAGTPNGSVVVGNYAVDPYTGDVFSATMSCYEEKNKSLEALQKQVRSTLHLTPSRVPETED